MKTIEIRLLGDRDYQSFQWFSHLTWMRLVSHYCKSRGLIFQDVKLFDEGPYLIDFSSAELKGEKLRIDQIDNFGRILTFKINSGNLRTITCKSESDYFNYPVVPPSIIEKHFQTGNSGLDYRFLYGSQSFVTPYKAYVSTQERGPISRPNLLYAKKDGSYFRWIDHYGHIIENQKVGKVLPFESKWFWEDISKVRHATDTLQKYLGAPECDSTVGLCYTLSDSALELIDSITEAIEKQLRSKANYPPIPNHHRNKQAKLTKLPPQRRFNGPKIINRKIAPRR